jgi:predicted MFS family arabinose efflux permease
MFIGMASGAFAASRVFAHYGFAGVLVFCACVSASALIVRSFRESR